MSKLVFSQKLSDLQKDTVIREPQFSNYQEKLYKSRLYGLGVYSKYELRNMSISDKIFIQSQHEKSKRMLRNWKLKIINSRSDMIIETLFTHSKVAKKFTSLRCNKMEPDINFSELGLSKKEIAQKMIQTGLLPRNFFNWEKTNKNENLHKI